MRFGMTRDQMLLAISIGWFAAILCAFVYVLVAIFGPLVVVARGVTALPIYISRAVLALGGPDRTCGAQTVLSKWGRSVRMPTLEVLSVVMGIADVKRDQKTRGVFSAAAALWVADHG